MKLTPYKPKVEPKIMYSRPDTTSDIPLNYEALRGEIVPLEAADFAQAQQISQRWRPSSSSAQTGAAQTIWAIYLHALAIKAFQRWFNQRTPPVSLDLSQAAILLPDTFDLPQNSLKGQIAVCQIGVAGFKICLVVTDGSAEDWRIPHVTIQNPRFAAHFYLPIVIHEESGQAEILGFLRHNQLPEITEGETDCRLALEQANSDLEQLLLYLTCLEPIAIPLPEATLVPQVALSQRLRQLLVQPVIRTRRWLTQQVDTLAEQLAEQLDGTISIGLATWQVLPPLELATATRSSLRDVETDSPMGDLSAILMSLMRNGMHIPLEQATAYQDLQLGDLAVRLYAVIAPQTASPELNSAEWSLLIIVRRQDRTDLPQGVGLQISDINSVLVDRRTETNQSDFLYGTAIGEVDEQFTVTLSYQGQNLTLPPFIFE
ncbi:MAG: hypothetical protein RLZZ511_4035 [Cyanobacteriota bacterium]|jgi:hypothetical protein